MDIFLINLQYCTQAEARRGEVDCGSFMRAPIALRKTYQRRHPEGAFCMPILNIGMPMSVVYETSMEVAEMQENI